LADAFKAAERIRNVIATNSYRAGEFETRVTTSIGLKVVDPSESEIEVLQKADQALYAAKNGGRNCCFYHDGQACQRFVCEPAESQDDFQAESDTISTDVDTIAVLPENPAKSPKKAIQSGNVEKSVP
jgi:predicted signal transduction protein with EAL and GGDEF domain